MGVDAALETERAFGRDVEHPALLGAASLPRAAGRYRCGPVERDERFTASPFAVQQRDCALVEHTVDQGLGVGQSFERGPIEQQRSEFRVLRRLMGGSSTPWPL
jgi:hypothetical protein